MKDPNCKNCGGRPGQAHIGQAVFFFEFLDTLHFGSIIPWMLDVVRAYGL